MIQVCATKIPILSRGPILAPDLSIASEIFVSTSLKERYNRAKIGSMPDYTMRKVKPGIKEAERNPVEY